MQKARCVLLVSEGTAKAHGAHLDAKHNILRFSSTRFDCKRFANSDNGAIEEADSNVGDSEQREIPSKNELDSYILGTASFEVASKVREAIEADEAYADRFFFRGLEIELGETSS